MHAVSRLVLIAALLGPSLFGADLFPLQEGNTWTYREARFGGMFTVSVGAAVESNGQTYYTLTGYVPKPVLVRVDDQNRLVYADPDSGQEAVLTYFAPLEGGGLWSAPLRMCGEQARAVDKSGVVELQYQTLTCADAGDLSERYAATIGMVQRVTQSITGPRHFHRRAPFAIHRPIMQHFDETPGGRPSPHRRPIGRDQHQVVFLAARKLQLQRRGGIRL